MGFPALQPEGFEVWVGVPVHWSGQVIGVLEVIFSDPQHFTHYEVQALSLLANQAAVAIENTRLYEEVRGARDQLQLILDSTDEAMLLFDGRGRLLRFNPGAEGMIGHPLHLRLGQSLDRWLRAIGRRRLREIAGLTPRDLGRYIRQIQQNPAQPTRRQFEQVHAGETRHIYETGSPVLDEDGKLAGWLLVWRDNTEEHKVEALRHELSNMIVHDLRNPISTISNGLDMLREWLEEGDIEPAMAAEVIHIAQDSANSLLNLVQSLLDVARLEENRMTLHSSALDLAETADCALASVMNLATNAGIEVGVDVPPDFPLVCADGEKIQRVLANLLDNALRYTPFGGRIVLSATLDGEQARICVEDNGVGVPPDVRDQVFDKYAQLENRAFRGHKGTGLGLAFCKLAVEAHGGRIWIEDSSLGGAAFCFTLPLAAPAAFD
jgi:PAS domain S-box-containing protein